MTDPMDDLRQSSAEVSGVKVLSPAAQAVSAAYYKGLKAVSADCATEEQALAAALRAAADQVVPEESPPSGGMRPGGIGALILDEAQIFQRASTRRRILAIAAELEGANG